jgi:CBS domain-containing protein
MVNYPEGLEGDEAYDEDEPAPRPMDYRMLHDPTRTLRTRPAVSVPLGSTVLDAVRQMQRHRVGCVMVVAKGQLVGILSERDLLDKVLGTAQDLATLRVETVMTPDPEALTLDDAIVYVFHKMSVGGFRHVPLVDDDRRPAGMISVKDLVDWIAEFFPREVLNVPPEPGMLPQRPEGG